MRAAVIDTSVYIDHWERGLHGDALGALRGTCIIRLSSVVLSELRRGARTPRDRRLVDELHGLAHAPLVPTDREWWEAGELVRTIGDARRWDRSKRRDFQNDALIALTASRHGAAVVTTNQTDFALLAARLHFVVIGLTVPIRS